MDEERRRQELWAVNEKKEPVKLPIVFDGYGMIPQCPTCGEMPYSLEQCYWCGQRFIQDEETIEYAKPQTVAMRCFNCGTLGEATVSKYNGHKHFHCKVCGCSMME